MKKITYKCPECNGILDVKEDKIISYCPYCGVAINTGDEKGYVRVAQLGSSLVRDIHTQKMEDHNRRKEIADRQFPMHMAILMAIALFGVLLHYI